MMELKGGKFGFGFFEYSGDVYHIEDKPVVTDDSSPLVANVYYDARHDPRAYLEQHNAMRVDKVRASLETTAINDAGKRVNVRWRGKKRQPTRYEVFESVAPPAKGQLLVSVSDDLFVELSAAHIYVVCSGLEHKWIKETDKWIEAKKLKFRKSPTEYDEKFDKAFKQYLNDCQISEDHTSWTLADKAAISLFAW